MNRARREEARGRDKRRRFGASPAPVLHTPHTFVDGNEQGHGLFPAALKHGHLDLFASAPALVRRVKAIEIP